MDSGVLPMDCYEDMFKEITRKLYGTEDGLSTTGSSANATSTTPPVTTNANAAHMEQRAAANGQRYEDDQQQTLAAPFLKEETITAFGLIGLMQTSFPPAAMSGYQGQGHHFPHHLAAGAAAATGQAQTQSGQSQHHQNHLPITIPPPPQPTQQVSEPPGHVDKWISSDDELHWTRSKIATYNPAHRTFKCSECDFDGFMTRVGEHWIETHANLRVYQCPQCPYTSAWARCVRMHIAKQHSTEAENGSAGDHVVKTEPDEDHFNNATNNPSTSPIPSSLWKEHTVLDEVTKYLQRLKTKAESIPNKVTPEFSSAQSSVVQHRERNSNATSNSEKRYSCSYCPYATDRRDLFTRHENIHKDEKPFHCYVCRKQFNRADHVKKHFLRMHRDHPYDINKIRRSPPKNASGMSYYQKYSAGQASTSSGSGRAGQSQQSHHAQVAPQQSHFQQAQPHHLHPLQTPQHHLLQTPHYTLPIRTPQPKAYLHKQQPQQSQQQQNGMSKKKTSPGGSSSSSSNNSLQKEQKEKRFSCCYCSWSGVDNWCLKRHLNTHLKPFVCALCDYKAARSERLATHVLKVHNKRSCNKCSFLAEDQLGLTEHMHEHHKPKEKVMPTPAAPWNTVPIPVDQTLC